MPAMLWLLSILRHTTSAVRPFTPLLPISMHQLSLSPKRKELSLISAWVRFILFINQSARSNYAMLVFIFLLHRYVNAPSIISFHLFFYCLRKLLTIFLKYTITMGIYYTRRIKFNKSTSLQCCAHMSQLLK